MGLQRPELFIDQDMEEDEAMDDPDSMNGRGEDENYLDPLEALLILHLLVYGPDNDFPMEFIM